MKDKVFLKLQKNDVKIISFDIFDTLLYRRVPSEYVSYYSSEKLSQSITQSNSFSISSDGIFQSRCEFIKAKNKSMNQNWELQDWLFWAGKKFHVEAKLFVEMGEQAEIEAEVSSLKLLEGVDSFISELRDLNYRVIGLTDMWLNARDINIILKEFGISLDAVYTSGELKASKREGSIFKIIENDSHLHPKHFLHVGDNLLSDFIRPQDAGWSSLWVPRFHPSFPFWIPKPFWKGPLSYQPHRFIIKLLISNRIQGNTGDPLYHSGYDYLAPVLILFSLIQYKYFKKYGIQSVFFVARDGKLPFEVCKKIFNYISDSPEINYVRLSRKSVSLLYPGNLLLNAEPVPGKIGRKNIGEWISNFVISKNLKKYILDKAGESEKSEFSISVRKNIKDACRFYKHQLNLEKEQQGKLIKDYLYGLTSISELKRIGIVDSGWAGTIQDCLANDLEELDVICGVYLGVSNQGLKPCPKSLKFGILRDDYRRRPYHNSLDATAGSIRVWDTLLREPIGTVMRLKETDDGKIIPELEKTDLIGEEEKIIHETLLKSLLQRVDNSSEQIHLLIKLLNNLSISDLERAAVYFSRKITVCPEKKFAEAILDINLDEGSADGKRSSFGIQGLKDRIAWYPGIFKSVFYEQIASILIFVLSLGSKFVLFIKRR